MRYLFGPVNSRRLGLSLGVDLIPAKICSFDCLYCEVGPTTVLSCVRREYVPTGEILAELDGYFKKMESGACQRPDVITITASGEPTLHSGIGRIIGFIKEQTTLPLAVLTNGSLFDDPQVRLDLLAADVVVPSLDAVLAGSFTKLNRPAPQCADPGLMIRGLIDFREEFGGEIWLEVLLVEGINDTAADLAALNEAAARIRPDRLQLNTVVRPPADGSVRPLTLAGLKDISRGFRGMDVEIIAPFVGGPGDDERRPAREELIEMLRRRPCTERDIREALGLGKKVVKGMIEGLCETASIREIDHDGRKYYQTTRK